MDKAKQIFYLGTAIKITTVINIDTATAATITIKDSCELNKVTDVPMTKEANGVYSYIYQSYSTDTEGDYILTITVTYGGYISVMQDFFTMEEQI